MRVNVRRGDGSFKPARMWTLMAGAIAALILMFFWLLLLMQYLHVSVLQDHPIGLYTFMGLFTVALVLSFFAARVGSRYWYLEMSAIVLTMIFVLSTLH